MKVILLVATSQDGFIARDDDTYPFSWLSDEDQDFFMGMLSKHNLFVMGSKTFDASESHPDPKKLKVVLTSRPNDYSDKEIPDQLEFHNMTAYEFVEKYKNDYDSCLLLGGSHLYTEFLGNDLVDEIYLTLEPVKLNSGTQLLRNRKKLENYLEDSAKLKEKTLNKKGTLLKYYSL